MADFEFLKSKLDLFTDTSDFYCTGKYKEDINELVSKFMDVSCFQFRKVSGHKRGSSKRLKTISSNSRTLRFSHVNGLIPIPYNGMLFEIVKTDTWNCASCFAKYDITRNSYKIRQPHRINNCKASINIRTVKVYHGYAITQPNKLENDRKAHAIMKQNLLDDLASKNDIPFTIMHYCRFPSEKLHFDQNRSNSLLNSYEELDMERHVLENKLGLIAFHLGAGYHSNDKMKDYKELCECIGTKVTDMLKQGCTAGEAVTMAVKLLEDSSMTNAGFGSNLTESGTVECDASVMDASVECSAAGSVTFGAVSNVSTINNPVCAAFQLGHEQSLNHRLSMGRIPPCSMSGVGAENWAMAHGVNMCEKGDLISKPASKTWEKYNRKLMAHLRKRKLPKDSDIKMKRFDTVGAVAIDIYGRVASAVSSGGLLMKLPGRVGQAAMYGCGCWAENGNDKRPSVAISTSGCGEQLMYTTIAKTCSDNLKKSEPYTAVQETLLNGVVESELLSKECDKQAGLLTLCQSNDLDNYTLEVVWGHTTNSMLIAYMSTNDDKPEVVLSVMPETAVVGRSVSVSGTWIKMLNIDPGHSMPDCLPKNGDLVDLNEKQLDGNFDEPSCNIYKVDGDLEIMFLSPSSEGLTQKQCSVRLSDEFNRRIDKQFEKKINQNWEERRRSNPRLFNASKFRIHSVSSENEKELNFNIGLTCYRDYMETNWSKDIQLLANKGITDFRNRQAYFSDPLGVAGIVITSDNFVIYQKRSNWVAEAKNQLDVPGGHPEPSAVRENISEGLEVEQLCPLKVLDEIFFSQVKEVSDEVNIPTEKLGEPMLMGLVRNRLSSYRPVCYFLMKCQLNSEEILKLYEMGGNETDESTKLVFMDIKEAVYMQRDKPDMWKQFCPNGKAASSLFSILYQLDQGFTPFQIASTS